MNYIITMDNYHNDKNVFHHKLKALCYEYDVDLSEIYSKKDLQEFVKEVYEEDYY